jgi:hypothetical protein
MAAIRDEAEMRELLGGSPTPLVSGKIAGRLNHLTRQFIERSPFVCVATARPTAGSTSHRAATPPASCGSSTSARC